MKTTLSLAMLMAAAAFSAVDSMPIAPVLSENAFLDIQTYMHYAARQEAANGLFAPTARAG